MTVQYDPSVLVRFIFEAFGGKIQGRTKLQKVVYFVGLLTEETERLGYNAHYYGPYSAIVAEVVEYDRSLGFLDLQVRGGCGGDAHGFEMSRYDYELTNDGHTVVNTLKKVHTELWNKTSVACQKIIQMGDLNYVDLSIAAKTYHVHATNTIARDPATVAEAAKDYGWKVTAAQVVKAEDMLVRLGLSKSTA